MKIYRNFKYIGFLQRQVVEFRVVDWLGYLVLDVVVENRRGNLVGFVDSFYGGVKVLAEFDKRAFCKARAGRSGFAQEFFNFFVLVEVHNNFAPNVILHGPCNAILFLGTAKWWIISNFPP